MRPAKQSIPFVVPAQPVPDIRSIPLGPPPPKKSKPGPFDVSGDTGRDLETALQSFAFLVDFIQQLGTDELRNCAAAVRDLLGQP